MQIQKHVNFHISVAVLTVENFSVTASPEILQQMMAFKLENILDKFSSYSRKQLKKIPPINLYSDFFRNFGYSYPVLAQLESVLKSPETFARSLPLLDILFITELSSMFLMACHDLDTLISPLTFYKLDDNSEMKTLTSITQRELCLVSGDYCAEDQMGVITSVLKGPDYRTKVTKQTKNALYYIYYPSTSPTDIETKQLLDTLDELEQLLKQHSPDCKITLKGLL